jgi:hypothetical protein
MARGRSDFFDRAEQRGSELDKTGIDGDPVHKSLEDGTKIRYRDAKNLWAKYGPPMSPAHQFLEIVVPRLLTAHRYERTAIALNIAKAPSKMATIWKLLNTLWSHLGPQRL